MQTTSADVFIIVLISGFTLLLLVVFVGLFLEVVECLPTKWRSIKRAWATRNDPE